MLMPLEPPFVCSCTLAKPGEPCCRVRKTGVTYTSSHKIEQESIKNHIPNSGFYVDGLLMTANTNKTNETNSQEEDAWMFLENILSHR